MSDGLVTKEQMKRIHGCQPMNLTTRKKSFRTSTPVTRTNPVLYYDSFLITLSSLFGRTVGPRPNSRFYLQPSVITGTNRGNRPTTLFSRLLPRQNVQRLFISPHNLSSTPFQHLRGSHHLWSSQICPLVSGTSIWSKELRRRSNIDG